MSTSPGVPADDREITSLLRAWSNGDTAAFDRIMPLV
jgi:hypothetical protein